MNRTTKTTPPSTHVDPTDTPTPGTARSGVGDSIPFRSSRDAYQLIHDRVKAARGPASGHQCVEPGCDRSAQDWALKADPIGDTHPVRHNRRAAWISEFIGDYEPKCRAHHLAGDAARRREMAL